MAFLGKIYELEVQSEIPIRELIPGGAGKDLVIRRGSIVPPPLKPTSIRRYGVEALFGGTPDAAYLQWPGVVTILARDGCALTFDPVDERLGSPQLSSYLLSEALGLILFQRGCFLLHASAVRVGDGALVFAGLPGAGKSTAAAAFAKRGHTILADDMAALDLGQEPSVLPASSEVRLWPDSAEGLGHDMASKPRAVPGSAKCRIESGGAADRARLACIYILESGPGLISEPAVRRLRGAEALTELVRFFPCPSALLSRGALRRHYRQCETLYWSVPIVRLRRPPTLTLLEELIDGGGFDGFDR